MIELDPDTDEELLNLADNTVEQMMQEWADSALPLSVLTFAMITAVEDILEQAGGHVH